jgi:hypothetical protein
MGSRSRSCSFGELSLLKFSAVSDRQLDEVVDVTLELQKVVEWAGLLMWRGWGLLTPAKITRTLHQEPTFLTQ